MTQTDEKCLKAIKLALNNDWDSAHKIVQELKSSSAQLIHAVLHKIEGDESNSRYWYTRAGGSYEEFKNPIDELNSIQNDLNV